MPAKWKKKLEYFWMYYKVHFLIGLGIFVFVTYFGYAKLTEKEIAFQALLFDIHTNVSEEYLEREFAFYTNTDLKNQDILIATSLLLADGTSNYAITSQSKFYALIGTQDLDAAMLLEENFINYSKANAFLDLRTIFSEEELQEFPELYTDSSGKVIGIYGNALPKIREIDGYSDSEARAVIGVIYNTRHLDMSRKFLEYLLMKES